MVRRRVLVGLAVLLVAGVARDLFDCVQRNDKKRFHPEQDYCHRMNLKLPSALVPGFFHTMNQVEMLIDLQVAPEVSLIE